MRKKKGLKRLGTFNRLHIWSDSTSGHMFGQQVTDEYVAKKSKSPCAELMKGLSVSVLSRVHRLKMWQRLHLFWHGLFSHFYYDKRLRMHYPRCFLFDCWDDRAFSFVSRHIGAKSEVGSNQCWKSVHPFSISLPFTHWWGQLEPNPAVRGQRRQFITLQT